MPGLGTAGAKDEAVQNLSGDADLKDFFEVPDGQNGENSEEPAPEPQGEEAGEKTVEKSEKPVDEKAEKPTESEESESEEKPKEESEDAKPEEEKPEEKKAEPKPDIEAMLERIEDEDTRNFVREQLDLANQIAEQNKKRSDALAKTVGKQSEELGTLRNLHAEKQQAFQTEITQLQQNHVQSLAVIDKQIAAARESQNEFEVYNLEEQRDLIKRTFANQRWNKYKAFADSVEEAFLKTEGNEIYREIQPKFEQFLLDMGWEVIGVKSDPNSLSKLYPLLLQAEQGANIDKIVTKLSEYKLKQAAKVKNVAQESADGRLKGKPQPKKKDNDASGIDWDPDKPSTGGIL